MSANKYNYIDHIQRNIGIIDQSNQDKISSAVIAIAGCGADGGAPAICLARMGFSNFILSDPDSFDISNINRQEGAFVDTIGNNKADEIGKIIKKINPGANINILSEGINKKNVKGFLSSASLLVEEIDYRLPELSILMHQNARELSIPAVTSFSVGWNSYSYYFSPTEGMTFEEFASNEADSGTGAAFVPQVPAYIKADIIQDVLSEKIEIPVISPSVYMAAALTTSLVYFIITGEKKIEPAPYYYESEDIYNKRPRKRIF